MRQRKPPLPLDGFEPVLFFGIQDNATLEFCGSNRSPYLAVTNGQGQAYFFSGRKSLRALARTMLKWTEP